MRRDVRLVVDLDEHVPPSAGEQPLGGLIGRMEHRDLITEVLVLTKIEVAEDHRHPLRIRGVEHTAHPAGERRPQRSVFGEPARLPGLWPRGIAFGGSALEIDGDRQQPARLPFWQRGDEFADVALGVPPPVSG